MVTFSKILFFTTILVASFAFSAKSALAAQEPVRLYLQVGQLQVAPGSEIVADILVSSQNPINAFNVTLRYPADLLSPLSFNDSGSIVGLWQDRQWEGGNGIIKLSGGMFKPFSGKAGQIAKIRLRALAEGSARISFEDPNVYYADGNGTKADTVAELSTISITGTSPIFYSPPKDDVTAPIFEFLQSFKNPEDGKTLVVFDVKDTGSGLKEVSIKTKQWFTFGPWQRAKSPMTIAKGTWAYQISAIDNSGNVSTKTMYIFGEAWKKLAMLLLSILVVIIFYVIMKKRNRKFGNQTPNNFKF